MGGALCSIEEGLVHLWISTHRSMRKSNTLCIQSIIIRQTQICVHLKKPKFVFIFPLGMVTQICVLMVVCVHVALNPYFRIQIFKNMGGINWCGEGENKPRSFKNKRSQIWNVFSKNLVWVMSSFNVCMCFSRTNPNLIWILLVWVLNFVSTISFQEQTQTFNLKSMHTRFFSTKSKILSLLEFVLKSGVCFEIFFKF